MNTTLHISVNKNTKIQAQRVAQGLGIPLNTMVNSYLKKVAKQTIETSPYKMSKKLEKILDEVEKDIKLDRNFVGPFKNGKEAADYIRAL